MAIDPETGEITYKIKRRITVGIMQLHPGSNVPVTVISALRDSKPDKENKTVRLLRVIGFGDASVEYDVVTGTVLASQLEEEFPDETYVGKSFLLGKSADKKGVGSNQYYTYTISEIE